jgi:hypothetical protein
VRHTPASAQHQEEQGLEGLGALPPTAGLPCSLEQLWVQPQPAFPSMWWGSPDAAIPGCGEESRRS